MNTILKASERAQEQRAAALEGLATIAARLRAQVTPEARLWCVLPTLRQADLAIQAGKVKEATRLIIAAEAQIDGEAVSGRPMAWNILRVAPHMERRVRDTLADVGLKVYVPIEKRWPKGYERMSKAQKLRARPITRPLIPSYIFALLPDDESLDLARGNHAVREVMCFDGKPIRVPARELGGMVLFEACHAFDETWEPPKRKGKKRGKGGKAKWKAGQRVKVKDGPFAGFFAEVLRAGRDERVVVATRIFGRVSDVELEPDQVEVVGDGEDPYGQFVAAAGQR
jgi:transcription antitermination factor NusG